MNPRQTMGLSSEEIEVYKSFLTFYAPHYPPALIYAAIADITVPVDLPLAHRCAPRLNLENLSPAYQGGRSLFEQIISKSQMFRLVRVQPNSAPSTSHNRLLHLSEIAFDLHIDMVS
jgi:hypothetical protein